MIKITEKNHGKGFIAAADYELIMDTTARQTAIFYPGFYV